MSYRPYLLTHGSRLALLSLGTCLLGGSAQAANEPAARRADPRPLPQHLQDQLEAAPLDPLEAGVAKSNTFFLNYDGVTIKFTGGEDDSSQNVSQFPDFAMTYSPYGDGPKRAASMQALISDWMPYDVNVTDTRPQSGNYTMCVNTPTNPFGGGVLGIAPLDCGDQQGRNIVFAYHSANDQFSAATQATTMSQEIAHAFGLEHVQQENDIMNPYNAGGDPSFIDQCFALDGGGIGIQCNSQHQMFCPNGQNSHKELMWLFGPSAPDTMPPTCVISGPSEGQMFDAPADFTAFATANDDSGSVKEVQLFMNDAFQASDATSPFQWDLVNVPAGNYCFKCTAIDNANNMGSSNPVCVTVVDPGMPDTTSTSTTTTSGGPTTLPGTDSDSNGGTGASDTDAMTTDPVGSDTNVSPDSSALPPGFGQGEDSGCGCSSQPPGAAGLLLLALAGLRRRRRA